MAAVGETARAIILLYVAMREEFLLFNFCEFFKLLHFSFSREID